MISIEPRLLKRYFSIAQLLVRHGGSEWLSADAKQELSTQGFEDSAQADGTDLAADLEALGPTFVKLGQIMGSRPDLVPPQHLSALKRLRDDVGPFDGDTAKQIIREELGARVSKLFAEFDDTPLAAASLSQVHRAQLHDGRQVVVKVQRPNIRETMVDDLDALEQLSELIERHSEAARCLGLADAVEEFRRTLMLELDFSNERGNLKHFARMLADYKQLCVPEPIDDFCSSRVLTMDYLEGSNVTALNPVVLTEFDGSALASELFEAYLHQVLVAGAFHADPHPGNLLLMPDRRIAILDLGMIGRFHATDQTKFLKLLLGVAEGDGIGAARAAVSMGVKTERFSEDKFEQRIAEFVTRHKNLDLADIEVGDVIIEICRTATECGLRLPSSLAMLGKTLLQLEELGKMLNPEFDPHAAIRDNLASIMRRRMENEASPGKILTTLIETREFAEKLPRQIGKILDTVAENEIRIKVDAIDQNALVGSIRKIANRITVGLVLAALIIGAALLMPIQTSFTIFGYPGLAILLFLSAVAGGVILTYSVLTEDSESEN